MKSEKANGVTVVPFAQFKLPRASFIAMLSSAFEHCLMMMRTHERFRHCEARSKVYEFNKAYALKQSPT